MQVLSDFKLDERVPHPTVLLVGKRFTGKSTTSVALANLFTHVHRWAAWCGTKETEDYWSERFGSSACVWGADEAGVESLRRLVAYQQRKVRLYSKILKKPLPPQYSIGMIFDDVTSCRAFRKGELLEDLFSNGRHYKAVIIISCQYPKQLPPAVRTNTDYLFMLHNTKRTSKILFEEYVENPDDFGMFTELLRKVTGQRVRNKPLFNALVYNNCVKTNRLDEMFHVFRHTEGFRPEQVELGSGLWRDYNRAHYKNVEETTARKNYNKRERMKQLSRYREGRQTNHRLGNPIDDVDIDLDYFSDQSSNPLGSDTSDNDTYTLRNRKREGVVIRMARGHRQGEHSD